MSQQQFATPQDALAHYGVKGMKWGVRNSDRPKGKSSSSQEPKKINVKKAERHEKNAAEAQKVIDEISSKTTNWKFIQNQRDAQVRDLTTYRDQQLKDATAVREGRLTDGQRTALIGASVAAGLLVAYGTYKYADSGKFEQDKKNLTERVTGEKFAWKKNDRLAKLQGEQDILNGIVKQVNPDFGSRGTKMNCRRCTFAYELRRRGYDVTATKSSSATGQTSAGMLNAIDPNSKLKTGKYGTLYEFMKEFDGGGPLTSVLKEGGGWGKNLIDEPSFFASNDAPTKSKRIFDGLRNHEEGARGEIAVGWTMGGGHSMAWEIVGGKPVIFDAQSGKSYGTPDAFESFAQNVTGAGYTRLDNVKLNDEFLKRWVRNAD